MKRILFIIGLSVPLSVNAITLNATKIGSTYTTTPATEIASQALSGFRYAFTPMNVGLTVGSFIILQGLSEGVNSLRSQVLAGNAVAPPAPQGWQDANTPPQTQSQATYWKGLLSNGNYSPFWYSSAYDACQSAGNFSTTGNYVPPYTFDGTYCRSGNNTALWNPTGTYQCPVGYTLVSGNCTLTTPSAVMWPSDAKSTYVPSSGGSFTPHSKDPDNTAPPTGTRTGTDPYGNPVSESISSNEQGGMQYQRNSQTVDPVTGQNKVQIDTMTTDGNGQITSMSTTTANNTTVNNIASSLGIGSGSVDVSALAKEDTLQVIKDDLHVTNPPSVENLDQAVIDERNAAKDQVESTGTDLTSMPGGIPTRELVPYWTYASGTCYPATFDMGQFGTLSLQKFCDIYDEHIRPLLVFVLGVLGMLAGWAFWGAQMQRLASSAGRGGA